MIYDIIWNLNYFIKRPLNSISLVIIKEGEPSKTTNSPSYDKNVLKSSLILSNTIYSQSYFPPTKYYKSSLLKRLSSIKTKGNASPFKFKRNSSFLVPLLTIKTARMNNPKLKIPLNSARRNSTYFQQTIDPLKTKIPLFQLQVSPIEPKPLNKPPLTNKALRRLLRL